MDDSLKLRDRIHRAQTLIGLSRHREALAELSAVLATDPTYHFAHALTSLCHTVLKEFPAAVNHGRRAVSYGPESGYNFYILAIAQHDSGDVESAESTLLSALHLDSNNPDYLALMALLKIREGEFEEGLEFAEQALGQFPHHNFALHMRAAALRELNRIEESSDVSRTLLGLNAENPRGYLNLGWNEIYSGNSDEASRYFMEALRLEPGNAGARQGYLQTLHASLPFFRQLAAVTRSWNKLTPGQGLLIVVLVLAQWYIAWSYSLERPVIHQIVFIYGYSLIAFLILVNSARPLANAVLLVSGRHKNLMPRDEIRSSILTVSTALLGLIALAVWLATDSTVSLHLAVGSIAFIVPIARVSHYNIPRVLRIARSILIGFVVLGLLSLMITAFGHESLGRGIGLCWLFGIILFILLTDATPAQLQ